MSDEWCSACNDWSGNGCISCAEREIERLRGDVDSYVTCLRQLQSILQGRQGAIALKCLIDEALGDGPASEHLTAGSHIEPGDRIAVDADGKAHADPRRHVRLFASDTCEVCGGRGARTNPWDPEPFAGACPGAPPDAAAPRAEDGET